MKKIGYTTERYSGHYSFRFLRRATDEQIEYCLDQAMALLEFDSYWIQHIDEGGNFDHLLFAACNRARGRIERSSPWVRRLIKKHSVLEDTTTTTTK
jgi:hypothetical protein